MVQGAMVPAVKPMTDAPVGDGRDKKVDNGRRDGLVSAGPTASAAVDQPIRCCDVRMAEEGQRRGHR